MENLILEQKFYKFYDGCDIKNKLNFKIDTNRPVTGVFSYKEGEDLKLVGKITGFKTSLKEENLLFTETLVFLNLSCRNDIISKISFMEYTNNEVLILVFISFDEN